MPPFRVGRKQGKAVLDSKGLELVFMKTELQAELYCNYLNSDLKISFDFDSTLSETEMQELATKFLKSGAEIFVTTSRTDYQDGLEFSNSDLFEVTDRIGIKRENITFTKYDDKYKFVKDYDLHFDDDEVEMELINRFLGKCIGVLYEPKFNNQQANF